jgi:thiamine-phosphate pyrophosphorylase
MREIYRILDANFNRAREALRVIEDCGRFALNDPAITAMAKHYRSDLRELLDQLPHADLVNSRDTPGDLGRELTSPTEPTRDGLEDVATAACKRLTESLRTIEEYCKVVAPAHVTAVERMRYDTYTLEQRVSSRFVVAETFGKVKLYVLLSADLCNGSLRDVARAAIAGGAEAIQLREKHAPDAVFLAQAAELRELTDETARLLIINDRPDIAAIVGADGVHLGQGDLPIAETRRLLRPGAIVGKSTHSLAQAKQAVNEGADYVGIGAMFPTDTKDSPLVGPEVLAELADAVPCPVVPIGGINAENVGQLVAAGATAVAVSTAVCSADAPQAAAKAIRDQLPE